MSADEQVTWSAPDLRLVVELARYGRQALDKAGVRPSETRRHEQASEALERLDAHLGDPPCDHIWVSYFAGETANALLGAPELAGFTFSEDVRVCTLCALIQPKDW